MQKLLWLISAILLICILGVQAQDASFDVGASMQATEQDYFNQTPKPLSKIQAMLYKEANTLSTGVINKTMEVLKCSRQYDLEHNNIVTIIDYSLPSSQKRLWVFDLETNKLLFHTYVTHGIKSGALVSNYFSNHKNSKASSIGVYHTEKSYFGRHGLSLKLNGLDGSFNNNAYNRFIVIHGAWYAGDHFIQKYGRAGRSWGCPAVPKPLTKSIIEILKGETLLIIYYPGENWFAKSKYLNCKATAKQNTFVPTLEIKKEPLNIVEDRGDVVFADINNNDKHEENEPVIVLSAADYQRLFNAGPPLERMLRRQINHDEYIALNHKEFKQIDITHDPIHFVIPLVKLQRGFYATEMKMISLGKLKEAKPAATTENAKPSEIFIIHFEKRPAVAIKPTRRFIRWLGL